MEPQSIISIAILVVFFSLVGIRAATMRKKGIDAIVDKRDFVLIMVIAAILVVGGFVVTMFDQPVLNLLSKQLWTTLDTGWAGVAFCAFALAGLIATFRSFGDSFRVGIDEEHPAGLITSGMFSISRNPIYMCMILLLLGMFQIHRNIIILVVVVLYIIAIHRHVLKEEEFLRRHYGDEYEEYCSRVRRYF